MSNDPSEFGGESAGAANMNPGPGPEPEHKTGHDHKPKPDDSSKFGGDTAPGTMNPKEPDQAALDADRAANPDTSEQVGGAERDAGGG